MLSLFSSAPAHVAAALSQQAGIQLVHPTWQEKPSQPSKAQQLALASVLQLLLAHGLARMSVEQREHELLIYSTLKNPGKVELVHWISNGFNKELFKVLVTSQDGMTSFHAIWKPDMPGSDYNKNQGEEVAYVLSCALGMEVVPPSAYHRNLPQGFINDRFRWGSLSYWVENA